MKLKKIIQVYSQIGIMGAGFVFCTTIDLIDVTWKGTRDKIDTSMILC